MLDAMQEKGCRQHVAVNMLLPASSRPCLVTENNEEGFQGFLDSPVFGGSQSPLKGICCEDALRKREVKLCEVIKPVRKRVRCPAQA